MSQVDATDFKAAVALAAVQLNAAMQDDTLSEMAITLRRPTHPLRKLRSLFNLNPKTGVWSSNDAYIDSVYAGRYPNAKNQAEMSTTDLVAITLTTATVEDAEPADIVLTFSRDVSFALNLALGGAGSAGKAISGVAIVDNVVTITVDVAYENGDVIEINGDFGYNYLRINLTEEEVTNNVAA